METQQKIMHRGSKTLLNPENSCLLLIDHQPQMAFGVSSIDRGTLVNNVVGLAKSARLFNVPTLFTTIAAKTFSGPLIPELQNVFPELVPIDRSSMNAWEDPNVVKAVKNTGRKKLVVAALWTEVCLTFPVLDTLEQGFETYIVEDASGGTSVAAHSMGIQRMTQAGAIPLTWMQFMLELQRDWSRTATYDGVMQIVKQHGGAYGLGVDYANAMLGVHPGEGTVAA